MTIAEIGVSRTNKDALLENQGKSGSFGANAVQVYSVFVTSEVVRD